MEAKYGEPWEVSDLGDGEFAVKSVAEARVLRALYMVEEDAWRVVQCVNACSGLDMSQVPAGAVGELVKQASLVNELLKANTVYVEQGLARQILRVVGLEAALAPFVREG